MAGTNDQKRQDNVIQAFWRAGRSFVAIGGLVLGGSTDSITADHAKQMTSTGATGEQSMAAVALGAATQISIFDKPRLNAETDTTMAAVVNAMDVAKPKMQVSHRPAATGDYFAEFSL